MKKKNELTFGRISLYLGIGIIVFILVRTIFEVNGSL